jgi:hypothetical protein
LLVVLLVVQVEDTLVVVAVVQADIVVLLQVNHLAVVHPLNRLLLLN